MFSTGARWAAVLLGAAAWTGGSTAHAQDGGKDLDRSPVRCVPMGGIKKTHAVDDRTIVFNVRGRYYRNYLQATCRDLAFHDRITYANPSGGSLEQICSGTQILVVDRLLRTDGAPCKLGQFLPISKEEAEILGRGPGEQRDAVKVESAQLPAAADPGPGRAPEPAPAAPER
ncbi:MAG TPA: hypothetical protein VFX89_00850 [Gammaproteobacteria bacterium]|nr:hypothetical protein [Gammaproteobacteria bacterium]